MEMDAGRSPSRRPLFEPKTPPNKWDVAKQVAAWETMLRERGLDLKDEVPWWAVDPRTSKRIGYWDAVTTLALVFTAIFTPFEVGFVDSPLDKWSDPLFLVNRVVDLVFITDMALQFVIMVPVIDPRTSIESWISSPSRLGCRYLTSAWAPIDVLSIAMSALDVLAPAGSSLSKLKALRAIRVLRLVKLAKILGAAKVFKRWEMRLSINYAKLGIAQILIGLVFICHLFACLWGMQASFDPLNSWPGQKEYCIPHDIATSGGGSPGASVSESSHAGGGAITGQSSEEVPCPEGMKCNGEGVACVGPAMMYVYSIYWAIATITSIGYGDVAATAFNAGEQIIATMIMLAGAMFFAQLVGSFCGLAAAMTPETTSFRHDISDLNTLMEREQIPQEMRYRLREYMHASKLLRAGKTRQHILGQFSVGLGGEFALQMGQRWLFAEGMTTFKMLQQLVSTEAVEERPLLARVAMLLTPNVYPHAEQTPLGRLHVCSHGHAFYCGRVKSVGHIWGGDEVFGAASLRLRVQAIASGYLQTYSLDGVAMRDVFQSFPKASMSIRWLEVRWLLRRGIVRLAEEEKVRKGSRFHGRHYPVLARNAGSSPLHARSAPPLARSGEAAGTSGGADRGRGGGGGGGGAYSGAAVGANGSPVAYRANPFGGFGGPQLRELVEISEAEIEHGTDGGSTRGHQPSSPPATLYSFMNDSFRAAASPAPSKSATPTLGSAQAAGVEGGEVTLSMLRAVQSRQAAMESEMRRLRSGMDEVLALLRAKASPLEV